MTEETCLSCGKWCHPFDRYVRGDNGPWHKLCLPPRNESERLRQKKRRFIEYVREAARKPFREKVE